MGVILAMCATQAYAEGVCGSLENAYGPYDYRVVPPGNRKIVETHHFTAAVERLSSGNTTVTPGPDIAYTLRAMPNHHRALQAMMNLSFKERRDPPLGSPYTVECWFKRAIEFRDNDGMAHALYGIFLDKRGRKQEALKELQRAQEVDGENANVMYNLGLVYFDLGDYEQSLRQAHQAYRLGFPLPGLRHKLERAGKWRPAPKADAAGERPAKPVAAQDKQTPAQDAAPAAAADAPGGKQ